MAAAVVEHSLSKTEFRSWNSIILKRICFNVSWVIDENEEKDADNGRLLKEPIDVGRLIFTWRRNKQIILIDLILISELCNGSSV